MTDTTIPQPVLVADRGSKPVMATLDRERASSYGGAVLLKAAERVYGVVKRFARRLGDERAPEEIRHTLDDLVRRGSSASRAATRTGRMPTTSPRMRKVTEGADDRDRT